MSPQKLKAEFMDFWRLSLTDKVIILILLVLVIVGSVLDFILKHTLPKALYNSFMEQQS